MAYYEDNVVWGTKKSLYDKMGKGATLSKVLSTDGGIYINNGLIS